MVFFCCGHSKNDEGDEERRSRRGIASLATINPAHVQLTQAPVPLPLPANTEDASDKWDLVAWLASVGIHRAVAGIIQQAVGPQGVDQPQGPLAFLCQLKDRATLAKLLQNGAMLEAMIDLLWKQVEALQSAGAATNSEIQSKFAGAIELSYSGLDTFFGGLEGVVGSPSPKLLEAMTADHTSGHGTESTDEFVTGNYGVKTTSKAEWFFVIDPDASPDQVGFVRWPEESPDKLPDHDRCRKRRPLADLIEAAEYRNLQLEKANQPRLVKEEIVSANLYTGPMFVKYNAVLRGLRSDSPFLKKSMISLCCPKAVADDYKGGTLPLAEAIKWLNKYTTTLHGINSSIIKMSKLTKATRVYRGISDMALPDEFWQPNEFGVKGGVESAFMSTTLARKVAMGYAEGDGSRMGIVIEVQQGMVNRGADISWLSQYAHEQEILFGPLTGIEVLRTRIDGSVVVIECQISINLTALTLEQVLSKRRKVVLDMCDQLAVRARVQIAQSNEWAILQRDEGAPDAVVEAFIEGRLMPLARNEAEHYNENASLGEAIHEAVAVADILEGWPNDLEALAKVAVVGDGRISMTAEQLVHAEGRLALALSLEVGVAVPVGVVHGLCALLWAREREASLDLELRGQKIGAEGLLALGRSMNPTLASLNLSDSDCTNNGGNNSGVLRLCSRLGDGQASGLAWLDLTGNMLNAEAGEAIASVLKVNPALATLNLWNNAIGDQGATAICEALKWNTGLTNMNLLKNNISEEVAAQLLAVVRQHKTLLTLCGLTPDQTDLSNIGGPGDGLLIVDDLRASQVLTNVNFLKNNISTEVATQLATVLEQHKSLKTICGLTPDQTEADLNNQGFQPADGVLLSADLRVNEVLLTLNLAGCKQVGVEGGKAIAEALKVNKALTSLNLNDNRIGQEGIIAIADALRVNSVLTDLNLRKNEMGGQGVTAIAGALKDNEALTTLNLTRINLTDEQKSALQAAAKPKLELIF